MAVEPFDVAFPVNFYSGGDTTKEAFGKHIQEIKRIYGIINSVNADKVSAAELTSKFTEINGKITQNNSSLQSHIDSTNPHPNYKPSLSFSDISGKLETSKLTGKLPIRVVDPDGNPLDVETPTPASPDETYVVIPKSISSNSLVNNGYVKFENGLVVQWGTGTAGGEDGRRNSFNMTFPNRCFMVVASMSDSEGYCNAFNYDRSGFYLSATAPYLKAVVWLDGAKVSWIAIGN